MDIPLLIQILGVLIALFFCFLTFMCSKTWRVLHVIMSFLVFSAAVTFLVYTTLVLKTHTQWKKVHRSLENQIQLLEVENDLLWNGEKEGVEAESGIRALYRDLQRVVIDRGRVWRNCTIADSQDDGQQIREIRFQIPAVQPGPAPIEPAQPADPNASQPADPNAAQPADPNAAQPAVQPAGGNGITQNMLLYVFGNATWTDPDTGYTRDDLPRFYLGEFKVTATTPTEVTVVPTLPVELATAPKDSSTWTLYEIMPIDSHEAFAGLSKAQLESLFDRNLYPVPDAEYAQILQKYERDNQDATEEDPPENVWTEVVFKARHQMEVDSGSVEFDTLKGEFFDPKGLAIMAKLRRGELAELPPQIQGIFPKEEADQLAAQDICEVQRLVFRRTLTDYEFAFREIHRENLLIDENSLRVNRDMESLRIANQKGVAQIQQLEVEKQKLEQDSFTFRQELNAITDHGAALAKQYTDLRTRLYTLYVENLRMNQEIRSISEEITRRIDEETKQAGGQTTSTVLVD